MTQKWLKTNGLWPLYLLQINGIIHLVKGGAIMSTTRTRHGLQWVVSIAFVAIMTFYAPPGMMVYGAVVMLFHLLIERMFGVDLYFVSMLASVVFLVLVVRFIALPLALKGFGR